MIERYTCDGCGWDGLDNQGFDGGREAYFTERPDGGRDILCRRCIDHLSMAELAARAAFPEPRGEDDSLRPTVVAQAIRRILRAWGDDYDEQKRARDRSRMEYTNRWCAGCTWRPGCDCEVCDPEEGDAQAAD